MSDTSQIQTAGEEIFTETPFVEYLQANHANKSENYGYLGDREQEVLERLIDFIRVTEIRNLGYPTGAYHAALGGKNFGHCLLIKYLIFGGADLIKDVEIHLPHTKMLGSSFYFTFLHHNRELQSLLRRKYETKGYSRADYAEVKEGFRKAAVPTVVKEELLVLLQKTQCDFYILRSSASCEDGKLPSAGLFDSLVYYDDRQGKTIHQRLEYLERVLKDVYASLFNPPAISMMLRCGLNPLTESMSITFQPVIGDWYGDYFFPLISGVVKSTNTWPWGPDIRREDPVGRIGMGMGTFMVGETGGYTTGGPRVMSFRENGELVQLLGEYVDPETTYATGGKPISRNDSPDNGQTLMDVLAVEADGTASIRTVELFFDPRRKDNPQGAAAPVPAELRRLLASRRRVTDWASGQSCTVEIYDALDLPMLIRRGEFFDLGKLIRRIMDDLGSETRQAVSMEFAIRPKYMEGQDGSGNKIQKLIFEFHLLQVRPQTTSLTDRQIVMSDLEPGRHCLLARSDSSFGHVETRLHCAFMLTNEILELLGKEKAQALLREMDRTHRNAYLLIGPDAEEFVVGSSGFESLYSGLSPQAVISIKTRAGIHTLAGYSGSHAADNIDRAPVIIQEADRLEKDLQALAESMLGKVTAKRPDVTSAICCSNPTSAWSSTAPPARGRSFAARQMHDPIRPGRDLLGARRCAQ
jgi:hypothetical protein